MFFKFLRSLPVSKRNEYVRIAMLLSFVSFIEALGVASVMPFIALISDPYLIEKNEYLLLVKNALDISINSFIFLSGLLSVVWLAISTVLRIYTTRGLMIFSYSVERLYGECLFNRYMMMSYEDLIYQDVSEMRKNITVEMTRLTNQVIMPIVMVTSFGLSAMFLIFLALVINPIAVGLAAVYFFTGYFFIYILIKNRNSKNGKLVVESNTDRFKTVDQGFKSFKEIKIYNLEKYYSDRFRNASKIYSNANSWIQTMSQVPKFALEFMAFSLVIGIFLYLQVFDENGVTEWITEIAVFSYVGYRLMPAMQQIYYGISMLKASRMLLDIFIQETSFVNSQHPTSSKHKKFSAQFIELRDVCFSYKKNSSSLLGVGPLSTRIEKGNLNVLSGPSGSGKTTLLNLIAGLLDSTSGQIKVFNSCNIEKNLRDCKIGYVPQEIVINEGTIASNVAFGCAESEIDKARLQAVLEASGLKDFVYGASLGILSIVSEDGKNMSGGQRQRLGIARALYSNPDILLLDEVTSALDIVSERAILETLLKLKTEMIIILIAHRPAALEMADRIYFFDSGSISKNN